MSSPVMRHRTVHGVRRSELARENVAERGDRQRERRWEREVG